MAEVYRDDTLTNHYHFGALNRLESTFNYGKNIGAIYEYNGLGHRVGKIIGLPNEPITEATVFEDIRLKTKTHQRDVIDLTRQYHNLLQRTNIEFNDTQKESKDGYMSFLYDFGALAITSNKETLHYLHDDLGSPVRLMTGQGNEYEIFNYDEFGNSLSHSRSFIKQPFTYTGYQGDDIAETYYAQAREYSPNSGRFISQDPHWTPENMIYGDLIEYLNEGVPKPDLMAIKQSNNQYVYAINNPRRYVDPSGKFLPVLVGVGAVVGAVVGGVSNAISQARDPNIDRINLVEVGISAAAGAATGAIAASGAGWIAGAVVGTIAGGVSYGLSAVVNDDRNLTWSGVRRSAIIGGVFGAIGGYLGKIAVNNIRDAKVKEIINNIVRIIDPTVVGAAAARKLKELVGVRILEGIAGIVDMGVIELAIRQLLERHPEDTTKLLERMCME